jgi:hypothetical protein
MGVLTKKDFRKIEKRATTRIRFLTSSGAICQTSKSFNRKAFGEACALKGAETRQPEIDQLKLQLSLAQDMMKSKNLLDVEKIGKMTLKIHANKLRKEGAEKILSRIWSRADINEKKITISHKLYYELKRIYGKNKRVE